MALKRITFNDDAVVELDEVKAYCSVEGKDFDAKIQTAFYAACRTVQSRTGYTLAPDTYSYCPDLENLLEYYRGAWNRIEIPAAPIRIVRGVFFYDSDGTLQTIADSDYVFERNGDRGGFVRFRESYSLPSLSCDRSDAIEITFDAGFDIDWQSGSGDDPDLLLPPEGKQALLMLTERYFDAGSVDEAVTKDIDTAVNSLLDDMHIFRK